MKKFFFLLTIILFCFSCQMATYVHSIESTPYGVDYSKGKWLLNTIEAPDGIKPRFIKMVTKVFYNNLAIDFKY